MNFTSLTVDNLPSFYNLYIDLNTILHNEYEIIIDFTSFLNRFFISLDLFEIELIPINKKYSFRMIYFHSGISNYIEVEFYTKNDKIFIHYTRLHGDTIVFYKIIDAIKSYIYDNRIFNLTINHQTTNLFKTNFNIDDLHEKYKFKLDGIKPVINMIESEYINIRIQGMNCLFEILQSKNQNIGCNLVDISVLKESNIVELLVSILLETKDKQVSHFNSTSIEYDVERMALYCLINLLEKEENDKRFNHLELNNIITKLYFESTFKYIKQLCLRYFKCIVLF